MPLQAKFKFGALVLAINAPNDVELFRSIGIFSEAPSSCAKCGGSDIMPTHRETGGYDFYGLRCRNQECGAIFDLGQKKEGGFFPKTVSDRANHEMGWYFFSEQNFDNGGQQQGNQRQQSSGGQQRGQQQPPTRQGGQQQRQGPPPQQQQQRSGPPPGGFDDADEIPL